MNYETFHIRTLSSSFGFIQVRPGLDFQELRRSHASHTMTLGGRMATHTVGRTPIEWTLPLTHVTSETQANLTLLWRDQADLSFTFNLSGSNVETAAVRIVNTMQPFPQRVRPVAEDWQGVLILRTITGNGKANGGPFILGDATWGQLDQTYNKLI